MKQKLQLAESLVRQARMDGAAHAEVLIVTSDRRSFSSTSRDLSHETESAVHIRLTAASGATVSSVNTGDPATVGAKALSKTFTQLRKTKAQDNAGPPPHLDVQDRGLGILDRRQANLTDADRHEAIDWNEEALAAFKATVVPGPFLYEEVLHSRVLAATNGAHLSEESSRYRLSGSARHKRHPDIVLSEQITSRNFAEVASKPIGVGLGRRVESLDQPADLPSSPTAIVLGQKVVAELLPRIVRSFRAERIDQGSSFLKDRAGRRVGSDQLHVVDDALVPGGYATRAFDDRGIPAVAITLIREGMLGGVYQGVDSALRNDARPSGHECFDGSLWVGNLIVRPGNRSRNMIFPDLGTLVEIEDLVDIPTLDPVTGIIELHARVWVKDAKQTHGYAGTHRLRCPVVDLLCAVDQVCSDQERHGIVDTPTWVLKGLWFDD